MDARRYPDTRFLSDELFSLCSLWAVVYESDECAQLAASSRNGASLADSDVEIESVPPIDLRRDLRCDLGTLLHETPGQNLIADVGPTRRPRSTSTGHTDNDAGTVSVVHDVDPSVVAHSKVGSGDVAGCLLAADESPHPGSDPTIAAVVSEIVADITSAAAAAAVLASSTAALALPLQTRGLSPEPPEQLVPQSNSLLLTDAVPPASPDLSSHVADLTLHSSPVSESRRSQICDLDRSANVIVSEIIAEITALAISSVATPLPLPHQHGPLGAPTRASALEILDGLSLRLAGSSCDVTATIPLEPQSKRCTTSATGALPEGCASAEHIAIVSLGPDAARGVAPMLSDSAVTTPCTAIYADSCLFRSSTHGSISAAISPSRGTLRTQSPIAHSVPIVLDNGSLWLKAGRASDTLPSVRFRNATGVLKSSYLRVHPLDSPIFSSVGAEAGPGVSPLTHELQPSFGTATLAHSVTDWTALEQAWRHAFWRLGRCDGDEGDAGVPDGAAVLLTTHALAPWEDLVRAAELLFDSFGASAVHIAVDAALSLASSGLDGPSTGVVLEAGYGRVLAVPVFEGHVVRAAVRDARVRGRSLSRLLARLGSPAGSSEPNELATDRERTAHERRMEGLALLPDGQAVFCGGPSAQGDALSFEALFRPSVVECYSAEAARAALSAPLPAAAGAGLACAVVGAVASTDLACRREVAARVLVAGGVSATPGLAARLQRDLCTSGNPFVAAAGVTSHPRPQVSAWLGGAAHASLSSFSSVCTDRDAFYELRGDALRRTCQLG